MDNYSGSRDQDTYVRLGEAVTVHYRDEAGATLAPDQILSGRIGESYSSEPQDIAGYVLKLLLKMLKEHIQIKFRKSLMFTLKMPRLTLAVLLAGNQLWVAQLRFTIKMKPASSLHLIRF
ncbi:MucBP domain-containing protein [Lactobacillus sp. R2/2]|nr:MucBP domain-containing protein [Lactobacillus sp. R2/2]MEB3365095.1 MucBP domain-containing protein [Lactobacillus sp. R2/2]